MHSSGRSGSSDIFWCVNCLRAYHSKQRFNQHFDRPFVHENGVGGRGGKNVRNDCYQAKSRNFGKTEAEATMLKKQMEGPALLKFFRKTVFGENAAAQPEAEYEIRSSSDGGGLDIPENSAGDKIPNRNRAISS